MNWLLYSVGNLALGFLKRTFRILMVSSKIAGNQQQKGLQKDNLSYSSLSEAASVSQTIIQSAIVFFCDMKVRYYIIIGSSFSLAGSSSMLAVLATILISDYTRHYSSLFLSELSALRSLSLSQGVKVGVVVSPELEPGWAGHHAKIRDRNESVSSQKRNIIHFKIKVLINVSKGSI